MPTYEEQKLLEQKRAFWIEEINHIQKVKMQPLKDYINESTDFDRRVAFSYRNFYAM